MKVRESTTVYSDISFGHIGHTSKKVLSILIRVHLISIGIAVTKCKCCTGSALGVRNIIIIIILTFIIVLILIYIWGKRIFN